MELEKIALDFVNSLVPGKFVEAKTMLSENCQYQYGDKVLKGDEIIKSFVDNHEHAKSKLDKIEYIDGVVKSISGSKVTVIVKDRILKAGAEHIYTDRLIVGIGDNNKVHSIEYKPFPEEREKLNAYFKENNVEF